MASQRTASESVGGGGGGDESASASPRNRVKFMCSYGGKILPRPADGHLKYIGGETRVVAIPRDISFSELMKKLGALVDGNMVLKYQLLSEDLDALVSVRSNEDVKHMIEEYDRQEHEGTPKVRAFLFPSSPVVLENQSAPVDHHAIEQRYIDAINNVVRPSINGRLTPISSNRPFFSISACSSPKSTSPESKNADSTVSESVFPSAYQNGRVTMHRVQSSPSIFGLGSHHQQCCQQHYHHHLQLQPYGAYQSPRQPQDHRIDRLAPALSLGPQELGRGATAHGHGLNQIYTGWRPNLISGGYSRCGYYDEFMVGGNAGFDRSDSVPMSPRKHM